VQLARHRAQGNCFYWAIDGECETNAAWMARSCPRACAKLRYCGEDPASDACSEIFECPVQRDEHPDCPHRARRGECRGGPSFDWHASAALRQCSLSCHLLDRPATSRTATRPLTRTSPLIDVPLLRHRPNSCRIGKERLLSALSGLCPNRQPDSLPWARVRPGCPRTRQPLTSRVLPLDERQRRELSEDAERRCALFGSPLWGAETQAAPLLTHARSAQ
jgi:hypothetical protein